MIRSLLLALAITCVGNVYAGSTDERKLDAENILLMAEFSKNLEKNLAARRVRLAIVGRLGRPPEQLPSGIKFTHVGIAIYSTITGADGVAYPGYTFYNLYQSTDRPSQSSLVVDTAYQFFASSTVAKAGVIVPSPELQKRLQHLVLSKAYAELHRQPYSVIANPLNLDYQNCTEFVVDLVTSAIYETREPLQIKANQRAHFKPAILDLGRVKTTIASMFHAGFSVSDHSGAIRTATFTTIGDFLDRHAGLMEIFTLCGEPGRC